MTAVDVNSLFASKLVDETTKSCINEDPIEIY